MSTKLLPFTINSNNCIQFYSSLRLLSSSNSILLMTPLNSNTELKATTKALTWPSQLRTPTELMQGLSLRTKLCLIRSPICSKIVLQVVGAWAYLVAHVFNRSKVYNIETFNRELRRVEEQAELLEISCNSASLDAGPKLKLKKPSAPTTSGDEKYVTDGQILRDKAPLITLSNHISCIDDPILWASLLPLTYYSTNTNSVRWSAAAVEICFSKPWHSAFFSLGKTFPIVRGIGIEQPGMEFAAALLRYNQWLHMFPEGRVMRDANQQPMSNKERGYLFKWGISKLILDYFKTTAPEETGEEAQQSDSTNASYKHLRILPFYHLGLDEILPIGRPYIPRFGKQITVLIRPSVIDLNVKMLGEILSTQAISSDLMKSRSDDEIKRIKLTNFLEQEVEKLIEPATKLHHNDAKNK